MTATQVCSECLHPRPGRHRTKCAAGLADLFATIDDRWPEVQLIGAQKLKTAGLGESAQAGYESTPLIDLTRYAHLDHNSKWWPCGPDDVGRPTFGVWVILGYWEQTAAKVRGEYRNGDWVIHQPWIADMVADLRTLGAQLRAATGDPMPKPVGWCTQILAVRIDSGPGEDGFLRCGEPVYMPEDPTPRGRDESIRGLPEISCPHPLCDAVYRAADLIRLKLAAEQDARRRPPDHPSVIQGVEQRVHVPRRIVQDPVRPWAWVTTEMYEAAREALRVAERVAAG